MDYGLLQGLAEGIKSGMASYKDTKQAAEEKAFKKRQEQMQMMQSGLQEDPSKPGGLIFTPEMQQRKLAESQPYDPNSPLAQLYGKVGKNLGVELPKDVAPVNADKILSLQEKIKGIEASKAATNANRNELSSNKRATQFSYDIDPSRARTGEFGKVEGRRNAAQRASVLFKQYPDLNIPAIQTRELATAVGNLLSGGSTNAVSQIEELVPHTLAGDANKIASWVTGNPRGLEQQKFIHSLKDTVEREESLANEQIGKYIKRKIAPYSDLKKSDPDRYNEILTAALQDYGYTPESLMKLGSEDMGLIGKSPSGLSQNVKTASQHPQADQALQWAQANPKDPRAQEIIRRVNASTSPAR